jgi:hypothetical protein
MVVKDRIYKMATRCHPAKQGVGSKCNQFEGSNVDNIHGLPGREL